MNTIPVFKPLMEAEELAAAKNALEMGWLGMGSFVGEFEQAIKDFTHADDRYVAAVSTGHAALHLALLIAGVGPGDEVITPSFNNAADFQAILAAGGEPVFCDIEEESLCIDLEQAALLVGPRTKAIIVMDYDCVLCDHNKVEDFARRYGLRVIHDAAHSFGSRYQGRPVGSFSDICMFSFDPVKTITCVDGGALILKTQEELERVREMRLIGMTQPSSVMYQNQRAWTYDLKALGFRYHMANLHAALGLAQLKKMDVIGQTRRSACRFYNQRLQNIFEVIVPRTDFEDIVPFLYYIRVPAPCRSELRAHLKTLGIDTGIHWQPGHQFTLLKDCRRGDLPVTERIGEEILSLPLYSKIGMDAQERVVAGVESFFRSSARK